MPEQFAPIDDVARALLVDIGEAAKRVRMEWESGGDDADRWQRDYEALRRLAAKCTIAGLSPIPPLNGTSDEAEGETP